MSTSILSDVIAAINTLCCNNPKAAPSIVVYLGRYQIIQLRQELPPNMFVSVHLKRDEILGYPFIRVTKWDYLAVYLNET